MIYEREWKHYKQTNFLHPKGLITFPTKKEPLKRPKSVLEDIIKQIRSFTTGIHGVAYIWEKNLYWVSRLFWFLVVAVAVLTCFFMYVTLSHHHSSRQMRTVVANSQLPIYSIDFPAIALCSLNHVNWLRYKAAEKKFLPSNASNTTKETFYALLRALDRMELLNMASLEYLENHSINRDIEKIPLNNLVNFMAFRCEELFVECYYAEIKYDCCKIFVGERTEKGYCMVFNSMVSEESKKKKLNDPFYPWKNRKAGEGSGLQFTLRYNKTFQRPQSDIRFGVYVMVKKSDEWSTSFTHYFIPNAKSYLAITPVISETSPDTRHLDPRSRQCLFPDEKSQRYDRIEGLPFNKRNCIVKCQQKNFIKVFNCTLPWFFPQVDVRECSVRDFQYIRENTAMFTYVKSPLQDNYVMDTRIGVVCDCVDSCTSLAFLIGLHVNKLPKRNSSYPVIKGDIYIGQNVITQYETRLHFTTFDLIAQFGGILGLCMGASVLSLAEIFYGAIKIVVLFIFGKLCQLRKVKPYSNNKFNQKSKKMLTLNKQPN